MNLILEVLLALAFIAGVLLAWWGYEQANDGSQSEAVKGVFRGVIPGILLIIVGDVCLTLVWVARWPTLKSLGWIMTLVVVQCAVATLLAWLVRLVWGKLTELMECASSAGQVDEEMDGQLGP